MIVDNVIFESDIEVDYLNELEMSRVITLEREQTFDTLLCSNVTVGKLEINGTVNDYNLSAIYDDTLMVSYLRVDFYLISNYIRLLVS